MPRTSIPASPERRSIAAKHNRAVLVNAPNRAELARDLRAEQLADHIRAVVDAAPPLTTRQITRLSILLRGGVAGGADTK